MVLLGIGKTFFNPDAIDTVDDSTGLPGHFPKRQQAYLPCFCRGVCRRGRKKVNLISNPYVWPFDRLFLRVTGRSTGKIRRVRGASSQVQAHALVCR